MSASHEKPYEFRHGNGNILLIACGALGREIVQLIELNGWRHLDVTCISAHYHHTPERIPETVRDRIRKNHASYERIHVLYGDCGTAGELDRVLAEEGVDRIPGPHCFSFMEGNDLFSERADEDAATFFLTDFFCRHFERIVWEALALDRRADMVDFVFGNYEKLVYLSQTRDPALMDKARECARRLRLPFEHRHVGYGDLGRFMGNIPIVPVDG